MAKANSRRRDKPWQFSLASLLALVTVIGVLVGMAAHARGPMFVGLILVAPFFFAGSMALLANYSPELSRAVLILLVIAAVVVGGAALFALIISTLIGGG
jgi:peptidoglycan/LPS O-acetylase OafA/YrhL